MQPLILNDNAGTLIAICVGLLLIHWVVHHTLQVIDVAMGFRWVHVHWEEKRSSWLDGPKGALASSRIIAMFC